MSAQLTRTEMRRCDCGSTHNRSRTQHEQVPTAAENPGLFSGFSRSHQTSAQRSVAMLLLTPLLTLTLFAQALADYAPRPRGDYIDRFRARRRLRARQESTPSLGPLLTDTEGNQCATYQAVGTGSAAGTTCCPASSNLDNSTPAQCCTPAQRGSQADRPRTGELPSPSRS